MNTIARHLSAAALTLAVGFYNSAAVADQTANIWDNLLSNDGAQALVAAIQVADGSESCSLPFADYLQHPGAALALLAPTNAAFEEFLNLDPGALNGQSVDTIESALPGLLGDLGLSETDLCNLLFNHAAVIPGINPGNSSEIALLDGGFVTTPIGTELPVAVGANGVEINYENAIARGDSFASNGVIHYLDTVIVKLVPPEADTVCDTAGECATDETLSGQCDTFLDNCSAEASESLCAGGGWFICQQEEIPDDVDETNVCSREKCAIDSTLAGECETFLLACLASVGEGSEDECVGGALLICRDLF